MDLLDLLAELEDQPAPPSPSGPVSCPCLRARGPSDGFTNVGTAERQWWVHAACGLPTAAWLAGHPSPA